MTFYREDIYIFQQSDWLKSLQIYLRGMCEEGMALRHAKLITENPKILSYLGFVLWCGF